MAAGCAAARWVEVTYRKEGPARFLAHLDVLRAFERAVRRAGLPILLTEGFNPRPKLVFAAPLGVGATGAAEIVALQLRLGPTDDEVLAALAAGAAAGLSPVAVAPLAGPKAPAYHLIPWAEWEVRLAPPVPSQEELAWRCRKLLARDRVAVERKTKSKTAEVDLRPAIGALDAPAPGLLRATLGLNGEHTAKPLEVVEALGLPRGDAATPHPLLHRLGLAPVPA